MAGGGGILGGMHLRDGQRDPAAAFPLSAARDDAGDRRQANRAVGIDPEIIRQAETAAASVAGVIHAHARARWTGRTLRVEIEGWVDPDLTTRLADALGRQVAAAVEPSVPVTGSFTWTARAA